MNSQTMIAVGGLVVAASATAAVSASCSSQDRTNENVGSTTEAVITAASQNYPVSSTFYKRNECSSTYVNGDGGRTSGHWIVAWNGGNNNTFGWAYSNGNPSANVWTAQEQADGGDFGDPGTSPCPDAGRFLGWASDPSVAAVYNPAFNDGGSHAILAGMAGSPSREDDIVVAQTFNGGQTWQNASYVDDANSCNSIDTPWVASNPVPPYDTFIAWDNLGKGTSYLQQIWFDNNNKLRRGFTTPLVIPDSGGANPQTRHRIAFLKLPASCTGGGEGVLIAGEAGVETVRCGNGNYLTEPKWSLTLYDPNQIPALQFLNFGIVVDPGNGTATTQNCLTANIRTTNDGGSAPAVYNQPDPSIAGDPTNGNFWMTYVQPSPNGTGNRAAIAYGSISCVGGKPKPIIQTYVAPDPCPVRKACSSPDGGPFISDDWQPTIGFATKPDGTKRVLAYWYGTRQDYQNNKLVGVYYMYSEYSGGSWSAWTTPAPISFQTTGTQETLPWNPMYNGALVNMWDYNYIGVNPYAGTFLAVWGGDNRNNPNQGNGQFESDLLQ